MIRELTFEEQKNVRTTLVVLRTRIGSWKPLAKMLGYESQTLGKIVTGRRPVTANLTLRVAYFLEMNANDVLAGKYVPTAACPKCGHVPDFIEERTVVDE